MIRLVMLANMTQTISDSLIMEKYVFYWRPTGYIQPNPDTPETLPMNIPRAVWHALIATSMLFVATSASNAASCSDGFLGLADTLTIGTSETFTGTLRTTSSAPPCALPVLPTFPAVGTGAQTVAWGATASLDTSFHGSVLVHSGGFLLVKPGSYRISALTLEWGATLRVDTTGTSKDATHPGIKLVVQGGVSFLDQSATQYPGLSDSLAATRIALVVSGAQTIGFSYDTKIKLQLVAPQSTLSMLDRTQFIGRFLVRKAVLANQIVAKYSANAIWDKDVVVIQGARRYWTNASSVPVSWTINGTTQATQNTESLPSEGPKWIRRWSGSNADSVQVIVDRTAPVVAISSPITGTTTNKSKILVSWTVDGIAKSDSQSLVQEP